jgi:hypothetical protein
MKRVLAVFAVLLVAALVAVPVSYAQAKSVKGVVVSAAGDTMTIKSEGKEMTFKITAATKVDSAGAGAAQAKSATGGVKFTDFVKPGGSVEVSYTGAAGAMTATEVRTIAEAKAEASIPAPPKATAKGTVTAVAGDSITIKAEKELKIAVTAKTNVIGTGVSTKIAALKEKGQVASVKDLVSVNDTVTVTYTEAGGAMTASEIRITARAAK